MNRSLLKHYAQALFSLGKGKTEIIKKNLDYFSNVLNNAPELEKFLSSPMVTIPEKETLLDKNFKNQFDPTTLGFLKVITKKKTISGFDIILDEYNHLYNEEHGILEGRIYTPFQLSDKTLEKMEAIFSKKFNRKVIFKVLIEKKIIAGMKVYVEDTLFDYSVDTKLNQVKNKLVLPD